MSAQRAFWMVVGLIFLSFVEGVLKAKLLPNFPFFEAVGAQFGLATTIITTKVINDVKEMRYADGAIKLKAEATDENPK